MVSEFKYKGYLEPLNAQVMTEDILACYPESYMQNVAMLEGQVFSVPYYMDIMVFWVNKAMTGDMEIETEEDFRRLLEKTLEKGGMVMAAHGTAPMCTMSFLNLLTYSEEVIMTGVILQPERPLFFGKYGKEGLDTGRTGDGPV